MATETETKVGLGQIQNPTPMWAKWLFRIILYAFSAAGFAVNALPMERLGLTTVDIKDINTVIFVVITLTHGATRLFGITVKPEEYEVSR